MNRGSSQWSRSARFQAHSDAGKAVGDALLEQPLKLHHAETTATRAAEQLDRASQAFSATYRHLSNAMTFARAMLTNLGVAMPTESKTAGKKRKVAQPTVKPTAIVPVPSASLASAA